MHRRDFYFGQQPTKDEMNGTFTLVEDRFKEALMEHGHYGIVPNPWIPNAELDIYPNVPADFKVQCHGGVGYTQLGERIVRLVSAFDKIDIEPYKPSAGKQRIVSVFIKHKRDLSDQRTDNYSNLVYWSHADSHKFEVIAGTEIANPGPPVDYPATDNDKLLLCDILITDITISINGFGTGAGQIDFTRTELWWKVAESYAAKGIRASEYLEVVRNLGNNPNTSNHQRVFNESFIKAWIRATSGGVAVGKFNIDSIIHVGLGVYNIILPAGLFLSSNDLCPVATYGNPGAGFISATVFDAVTVVVNTYDIIPNPADREFQLIVCGRPQITT